MTDETDRELARDEAARILDLLVRADASAIDSGAWSQRALTAARPFLVAHARREYRRRLSFALVAAVMPLPIIAVYDGVVLGWLYGIADAVLPTPLATLAVGGYAATTSLLLALTYAAIPVLVDRTQPWRVAR